MDTDERLAMSGEDHHPSGPAEKQAVPSAGHEPPVQAARAGRPRRRWYANPILVIGAITVVALGLRLYRLGTPSDYYFDEVYYAKDGCLLAGFDFRECDLRTPDEQTDTVHPPLGRLIIAGSEVLLGNDPFGWRFASAVAGALSVLLLAILAYRLFRSVAWAAAAGALLATEHLNFVQSRISMLDIFVAMFGLAGFLFLVLDREWIERRTPPPPDYATEDAMLDMPPDRPPSPIFRPWRLAAGVALGAAVSVKWSGALALLAAGLLALGWERGRRDRYGLDRPLWEAIRDESFGLFVFLGLVPIAVYLASYAGWFIEEGLSITEWVRIQANAATFSLGLRAKHPYASRPWEWIILKRPVAYYYECIPEGAPNCRPAHILGMGNPVVFWGSLLAIPWTAWSWVRRRDWRAGLIVVAFAVQFLPWFLARRTSFFFYMTPVTPFLVLADVYALKYLSEWGTRERGRNAFAIAAAAAVVVSIAVFAFFLPVLTGREISHTAWRARMWLLSWI